MGQNYQVCVEYDSHAVNHAGSVLVTSDASTAAIETAYLVVNNWRSAHSHPLNVFQGRLRQKTQEIDGSGLVAQRIKRLSSIKAKLARFQTMRLSQMQDIGGCRAIVSTVEHLQNLVEIYTLKDPKRVSRGVKHKLEWVKDYVEAPKSSGYRGVHMVFKYQGDRRHDWDGLRIEMQFRTYLQHAWATTVETVGTFMGQALKSSMGEGEWLRFFSLASSAFALQEGKAVIPGTPEVPDLLRAELRLLTDQLKVESHLGTYEAVVTLPTVEDLKGAHYYLLDLDPKEKSVKVWSFAKDELAKATARYLKLEKDLMGTASDAVLVSAASIEGLRRSYPNYFADTQAFMVALKRAIA